METIIEITDLQNEKEVTQRVNEVIDVGIHKDGSLAGVNNMGCV